MEVQLSPKCQDKNLQLRKKMKMKMELCQHSKDSPILTWEDSPFLRHTTLFKALPHTSIPLDIEITKFIQSLETNPAFKKNVLDNPEYFEMVKFAGFDRGPLPIQSGPVLYVKSISICKDRDWDDFQMFGHISITDYQKNIYYLYSCEPGEPHHVSSRSSLVFSHCPIAPVMGGKLKFSLRNPDGAAQIFKEDKAFSLDYSCKYDYGDDICQQFPLECGYYAKMVFNKIPFAVLSKCALSLNYKPPVRTDKVHGSVTVNNIVCIDRNDSSKAENMAYGKFRGFYMSTEVFALPIGLPLKVEYKLHHDDFEFANDTHEVPPRYTQSPEDPLIEHLPCKDENFSLTMRVIWILVEDFFYQFNPRKYANVKWSREILTPKFLKHTNCWETTIVQPSTDDDLVEVFSVFLGSGDSSPPALCGRIVIRDAYEKFYVFARNRDCPDKYLSTKSLSKKKKKVKQNFRRTVSLTWPDRWFVEKNFYMHLRLKDTDENPVCKGGLSWQFDPRRFDKRICDVIEGENGCFAAVHYSVFKNAKKAMVTVKCNEKNGYSLVYGRVFAAYDNDDNYPSTYDKECYRSIIFKRSKEDCVTVNNSLEIPLSKSHVSAPSDCEILIVDADLWVCPYKASSFQRSTAKMHFKACRTGRRSIQLGCFLVTVNWSQ